MVGRLQVGDMRRYLVITRHLNAQILSDLGATFQIDNLNYTPNKINELSMPLRSSAGSFWAISTGRQVSGAQAARAASSDIANCRAGGRLILLFILVSSVGLYKLARGESQARLVARTDWLSHTEPTRVDRSAGSGELAR
jgi:hypothetical protein